MTHYLFPQWPAPKNVRSAITLRTGGFSEVPWQGFNLGDHVGDNSEAVASNRLLLQRELGLKKQPSWLRQVHGDKVLQLKPSHAPLSMATANALSASPAIADAAWSCCPQQVCAILSADCLPLLLCHQRGKSVAAIHGGWRSLAAGIVNKTVAAMAVNPEELMAYLGPAIGPSAFEVGVDVFEAFVAQAESEVQRRLIAACFTQSCNDKWLANIYGLATYQLQRLGVSAIYGGDRCTYNEPDQFYSYRRDGVTGRMATLIWLEKR